jgi:hypothetical protein
MSQQTKVKSATNPVSALITWVGTEEMYHISTRHLIFIKVTPPALGYRDVMQRIVHSLSCLVLAFALILTGPGGAGPAKGAMLVELCADTATSLVWIDAEGNPIAPGRMHAKCLDCLLFSAPLPNLSDGLLTFDPLRVATDLSLPVPPSTWPIAHLRPSPRGPPAVESEALRFGGLRPDAWSLHLLALQPLEFNQVARMARVTEPRAIL